MILITFEGIDGSGKSVQIDLLENRLQAEGLKTFRTVEPGGSLVGVEVKRILADPDVTMNALSEFMLFSASRAELTEKVLLKWRKVPDLIMMIDRFADSSVAYQSFGRGLSRPFVEGVNEIVTMKIVPDLTIWLDVPAEECRQRLRRRGRPDRMDRLGPRFFDRVRQGYETLHAENPDRIRRVDGVGGIREVNDRIFEIVTSEIRKKIRKGED